jgi:putative heme degradation protein
MKYVSGTFLVLVGLFSVITVMNGMEKRECKAILSLGKIELKLAEDEKIDKKEVHRILSASHMRVIDINPRASHIVQVIAMLRNHMAIHNQVVVYDEAQNMGYAQFVIRKTVEVVDGLDRLAKL